MSRCRGVLAWLLLGVSSAGVPVWAAGAGAGAGAGVGPVPVPAPKDDKKDDKKDKEKEKDDKPKGPNHNVTLAEESGVLDLLARAQKARTRAEADPQVWPECVKYYADILKKYPNTVYLERWEGPDNKDMAFKNGLYKSTRERVARDIASLPEKGLATYQLINDPVARSLYLDGQEQLNDRKMEQVAQDYFSTSFGDDALLWLAEYNYDRGAARQSTTRLTQLSRHPNPDVAPAAVLVLQLLAQIQSSDKVGAEKTLKDIAALNADAQKIIRAGHDEGTAAVEKLKKRVDAIGGGGNVAQKRDSSRGWETYFGNAAHNRTQPQRASIGVLKWSVPIVQLLYGPNQEVIKGPQEAIDPNTQTNVVVPETQNQHLTVQDGLFYLCDSQLIASYPLGNPKPGAGGGGNAKFLWPGEIENPKAVRNGRVRFGRNMNYASVRHQPYFATVGGERVFVVIGPEPSPPDPWNQQQEKPKANAVIALGAQSGKLQWSLQQESGAFQNQSKADQEWLKGICFVGAPTYDSGVLYCACVVTGGSMESWVAALDADTGRLLWRTMICSAAQTMLAGPVQPALSIPVSVSNGTVFICTNLGAVASLEASTGGVKWIRVYDRIQAQANRFNQWDNRAQSTNFWGPNPPIVWENLLIVTPQDSDMMYAYYIESDPNSEGRIVGGKRAWQVQRAENSSGVGELKHIMGISNGHLFLSGSNVSYYELKSGKKAGPKEPFNLDSPIKGRGITTENMVFIPTEKALVRLDVGTEDNHIAVKFKDAYKWADPVAEAGNIFLAGDVLYTTSHTHVNAYFVWEEMEAKLKDRIAKQPDEVSGYTELVDVYQRVDLYDKALVIIEDALKNVQKTKDEKSAASVVTLLTRKFDVLFAKGEKARTSTVPAEVLTAYDNYKKAHEVSLSPGLAPELPVTALKSMAEAAVVKGDLATAVAHYQEIILKHGEVPYTQLSSASKARLLAQAAIEDLRRKDIKSYEKVEAQAVEAFTKAGEKAADLEGILQLYPNADVGAQVLLKLTQITLEASPEQARNYAQRYLRSYFSAAEAPQATAYLAVALERLKSTGQARDMLRRLAMRKEFAEKTISVDPLNPKTKLAAPIKVAEWAGKRLQDPMYLKAPSIAQWSLGNGKLRQSWTKPITAQSLSLQMTGNIPATMRNCVFFVEKDELAVISGTEKGDDVWTPRPKLPNACATRGVWSEGLLLMWGDKELVAFDSNDKGKVAWKKNHLSGTVPLSVNCVEQRIVLAYPSGLIGVLDAASGAELWRLQVEGNAIPFVPACGEGFIAVFGGAPPKLTVYNLDSGAVRSAMEMANGLALPPLACGDRLYCVDRANMLHSYDGFSGKLLWEHQFDANVTQIRATRELVLAVVGNRAVKVLSPEPTAEKRYLWEPELPGGANVQSVLMDADDLYVSVVGMGGPTKAQVMSFSVKAQGKFQWPVEISSEAFSSIALNESTLTLGHLVLTQSNWDPSGAKPSAVVLVDRKNGKLTWDTSLSSEVRPWQAPDGTQQSSFSVQMFDGGVVVSEGKKRVAYVGGDARAQAADPAELLAKLEQNAKDVDLRTRAAGALAEKGDREKAIVTLVAGLAEPNLPDDRFSPLYDELARIRKEHAAKTKVALPFTKVAKAPAIDGTTTGWTAVPEKAFDGWRDVFLASEDDGKSGPKKALWKGATDLKVSFRGAYDDKNLYVMLSVTDDTQRNDQTEASQCDLGDSARLVFDIERDGGLGWRGEDFMLGAALNKAGQPVGWRWVESSRYMKAESSLKFPYSVTRKDADKLTVYQFSLPLDYIKIGPEPGKKFGFSFVINDQDGDGGVEKSIAASPGVSRPPNPGTFAEGELLK